MTYFNAGGVFRREGKETNKPSRVNFRVIPGDRTRQLILKGRSDSDELP